MLPEKSDRCHVNSPILPASKSNRCYVNLSALPPIVVYKSNAFLYMKSEVKWPFFFSSCSQQVKFLGRLLPRKFASFAFQAIRSYALLLAVRCHVKFARSASREIEQVPCKFARFAFALLFFHVTPDRIWSLAVCCHLHSPVLLLKPFLVTPTHWPSGAT